MNRKDAMTLVGYELDWQNTKWKREPGEWPSSSTSKLTVLAEEFGEVARAILEDDITGIRDELVDCAAVCVAWLMSDYEQMS